MTSGERCDFLPHVLRSTPSPAARRHATSRTIPTPVHSFRDKRSPLGRRPGAPRPGLPQLLVLLFLTGGAVFAGYAVKRQRAGGPDSAGNDLQAGRSSSMLRVTSVKAPSARPRPAPPANPDRQDQDQQVFVPPAAT